LIGLRKGRRLLSVPLLAALVVALLWTPGAAAPPGIASLNELAPAGRGLAGPAQPAAPAYATCILPDNGSGTADLPPLGCPYVAAPGERMYIIDGLPPGTTIDIDPTLHDPFNISVVPGGTLGGEVHTFEATLFLHMVGTGDLAGFTRNISMLVSVQMHSAPRTLGDPIQTFAMDLFQLQGTVVGDPDFDSLSVVAGTNLGLPSPGETTLTRLSSGDFTVDSFFDITYQIDFQGAPGSPLDGLAGITTGTLCMWIENVSTACRGRDEWTGTVGLPPDACHYEAAPETHMHIVVGLPPNSSIDILPTLHSYTGIEVTPGGIFGGEVHTFDAILSLPMAGTGSLAGFTRFIEMPVAVEMHSAPHTPGDPVQAFLTDIMLLEGTIIGDPDFNELTITMGGLAGLPSPGHTTLTQLPSGDFAVDSFFDITYRIDFEGAPGSQLAGMSGSTVDTVPWITVPIAPCLEHDNRLGTVDLPPGSCDYVPPGEKLMYILNVLPPNTTIEIDPRLHSYSNVVVAPGGVLGGEIETFDALLTLDMVGTGDLAGFARTIVVPAGAVETHSAPRTPGDPVQTFATDLRHLGFLILGDPDFFSLELTVGTDHGLPSPGQTTLTELPSGDFAVDSFFDISYRIDFIGAGGSPLDGFGGTTMGEMRLEARGTAPWRAETYLPLVFRDFSG
jgi:hypothetical protein